MLCREVILEHFGLCEHIETKNIRNYISKKDVKTIVLQIESQLVCTGQ